MAKQTRGIRNCNPGNIRKGCNWKGLRKTQTDKEFCQFTTMSWGLRALCVTLRTYITKRKCISVSKIINRWAPPSDNNNTKAYTTAVALEVGKRLRPELESNHELEQVGLNYEFSSSDLFTDDKGVVSKAFFGLVKSMCWVESRYMLDEDTLWFAMLLM